MLLGCFLQGGTTTAATLADAANVVIGWLDLVRLQVTDAGIQKQDAAAT